MSIKMAKNSCQKEFQIKIYKNINFKKIIKFSFDFVDLFQA